MDSIFVENLTQGGDTTLYSPDTILVLAYTTGIDNDYAVAKSTFSLSQNYPNPFKEQTSIQLNLLEMEQIEISIRDIVGRELMRYETTLNWGNHSFTIYAGREQYYLLTVTGKHASKMIKMISVNNNLVRGGKCKLVYNNREANLSGYKSQHLCREAPVLAGKALNSFVFNMGDELQYTGYAGTIAGIPGSNIITGTPQSNTNYEFEIIKGIRCPGMPTVSDIDGNTYNTVQIGSQCWMAENLKTTTYNNGIFIPNVTGNWSFMTTDAYVWYDNDISWKDQYGAIYNWYAGDSPNELCPSGWHVPSYDEWTALTTYIGGSTSPHGNKLKSCRQVNSPQGGGCNTTEQPRWNESSEKGTDDCSWGLIPRTLVRYNKIIQLRYPAALRRGASL